MRTPALLLCLVLAGVAAGCGASKHKAAASPPATTAASPPAQGGAGALQAEARSAATGDIPDNQAFVVFTNAAAGYSMKYPEGWAQRGGGKRVVISDKNNIVRVLVRPGALPSAAAVTRELTAVTGARIESRPASRKLPSGPSLKVVYSTESAPSPVTGKRVRLVVDRYYVSHGGRLAIVDLGTPAGVDNVDAYRSMIESFRWR
jgi:hypothetical protein